MPVTRINLEPRRPNTIPRVFAAGRSRMAAPSPTPLLTSRRTAAHAVALKKPKLSLDQLAAGVWENTAFSRQFESGVGEIFWVPQRDHAEN